MHRGHRYLVSFFLAAALASPLAIAQQDHKNGNTENQNRVYDKDHKDYHNWDANEDRAWGQFLTENHKSPHDFKTANQKEQSQYWNWRHAHPDKN